MDENKAYISGQESAYVTPGKTDTQEDKKERCGAKTRTGKPCKNFAMPNGRCRLHGGKSTGPKDKSKHYGNTNAVKTGEYETILFDALDDEEKELYNKIDLDRIYQVDQDIKITEIRLRRMFKRIEDLKESDFRVIQKSRGIERGRVTEMDLSEDTLSAIQRIEDAITRVQQHKTRLIRLKHEILQDLGINLEEQKMRIEKYKSDIERATGDESELDKLDQLLEAITNEAQS